jgi:hypothetical protein
MEDYRWNPKRTPLSEMIDAKVKELRTLITERKEQVAKICAELGYTDLCIYYEEGSSETGTRQKPATLKNGDVPLCRWWLDIELGNPVIRFIVQPTHPDIDARLKALHA